MPVVLITGSHNSADPEKLSQAGFSAVLHKPYKIREFYSEVKRAFNTGTVLYVDDEESNREVIRRALREKGYGVLTANNPQDGFKKFMIHPVDVALLDASMHGDDDAGSELLKKMKETRPEFPVGIFSGNRTEKGTLEDAFLRKPADLEKVHNEVQYLMSLAAR